MFERLFAISQAALATAPVGHIRPLFHRMDWESPLNAILGSRGVGKTSLLLQRLQQLGLPPEQALYVDLGGLYFQENRLFEFAERCSSTCNCWRMPILSCRCGKKAKASPR